MLPLLAACGSKTTVWTPQDGPRPDAGSFDGSVFQDAGVDGGGGIVVDCGRSEQFTTPRREITLEATAMSDAPIVEQGWSLASAPAGATATNAPTTGPTTAITPDVLGEFLMRFSAADARGRRATCEVRVQAIVGPPVALCPEDELVTAPSVPLRIEGDGFDDEMVVEATWTQVSGPSTALLTPVIDGGGTIIDFEASVAGVYRLALEVRDVDGESDRCEVEVRVTAPPVVDCSPGTVSAPTRRPVTVRASATDERMVVSTTWELVTRPDASMATISPTSGLSTTMTPDRQGEYELRFTATDDDGLSASCVVTVIGTPTPPTVMCPAVVETVPLTPTEIVASAVDDGTIRAWAWSVEAVPPGSRPDAPAPANAARTVFTPDLAGEYTLRLRVTDDDGDTAECTTLVRAVSGDGLRVEMFWDSNRTDMDTHVLRPGARAWFDSMDDCFYQNCRSGSLMWGPGGMDDDPRLDIDDTDGFGPENINIRRPVPGVYRVGVHAFSGAGRVTVRIYCADSTTTPRMTFGPVLIDRNRVWRVADVDVRAAGCTITDLATGGRPNIITREESQRAP
ncbi:PKD domain-containing protein [Sandaracinus amylolyticus]|uniref:PKD domain-containing protein n=1 Tax=Sandaracinus amylolyticus TaxID=927083 RepID=UPI003AF33D86|nr:HYR domain-containing protein [Sandaracinus amylolyticus]